MADKTAGTADELTISYVEDGVELVKELDKEVLTRGAWATVIFRYQERNKNTGEYGPDKYSIRRYQKREGQYMQKSKFNISSAAQARQLVEILTRWTGEE